MAIPNRHASCVNVDKLQRDLLRLRPPAEAIQGLEFCEIAMTRPRLLAVCLIVAISALADVASAQQGRAGSVNAALKARDQMLGSYRQSGTIAGGYRPLSAWGYRNAARVQAQALNAYGEACPQVAPATANEHLAEIKRNLEASAKELEKFSAEAAQQADVKQHVDKIREHQSAALAKCGEMEQAIGKE